VLDGSVEVPRHWSLRARGDVFGSPAKVDVSLDAPDLASLLKLTPVELPAADGGSVAIEGSIVLPSAEGEWPSGKFTVTRARVDLGDRQGILAASGPVHASLAGGKLTVEEFSAVGEGTSIKLGGQVDLRDKDRGVNFAATGTVDASALSLVAPDIELQGRLTIDARASGSLDKPALSGSVRMEKGKYRLTGLGIILDEVDLTVTLRESRGDLEGRAKFGGGELVAGGSFNVAGLSVKDFRVSVQGRRVRLPTFQDFRVIANADLVVTAAPSGNAIRGEVVLLNATYFKDFDITLSDLLARSRPSGSALVEEWKEKTALEIHIVSSESMELRNKAARLTGTVDLVARGTVAEPTLLGQVAFDEGGRFTFRGVRYDIESGTVTFASTRGLAPILDIHARAEVKGYDLTVSLVGTWPRIQMSFSSDPPLPNETIFALLLTGTTPSTGSQSDTTSPIVSVGAGIAAGAVTGGITRGTQRVLKLERFEIDPIFTGGQLTDVRSTIGKQITPDILFTYSQSFETTKLPIVQVEWRISNTVILRAQRDENGTYLIDVRRRKRF
jgi:translocation and assembly module TamB